MDYNIIPSIPSEKKNAEKNILNIGMMRENGTQFSANFSCSVILMRDYLSVVSNSRYLAWL
jgi:hypothetical protein